jgi:DnaJ like chaperone protein
MSLLRSLVGGAVGFAIGGPLGAILGASIAYQLGDKINFAIDLNVGANETSKTQMAFFVATFSVMGHIAKVDGRVRPAAITFAEQMMRDMNLNAELRATAINLFQRGKKADFQLDHVLIQFYQECQQNHGLIQRFLTIQLQTAVADGELSTMEDNLLWHIANRLGVSRFQYERLKIQLLAQQYFHQQKTYTPRARQTSSLSDAYKILGLTPDATKAEVKKAYRRLMNQHHPDKLAAKGLSDAAMNLAKEKTQQISKAYEMIQKSGGV